MGIRVSAICIGFGYINVIGNGINELNVSDGELCGFGEFAMFERNGANFGSFRFRDGGLLKVMFLLVMNFETEMPKSG